VRGKAKANLYLDEFAHYPKDKEIYAAALPATTKGGRLRIGSSPLGNSGLFWEIYDQKLRPYPGFKRGYAPWWSVRALCRDVAAARDLAPTMLTEERVRQFGTPRLVEIFENMPLEDFQQEYECAWVDEASAWITWDEIKRNQIDAQAGALLCWQAKTVDDALAVIDRVAQAVGDGKVEEALAGGMDVGRTRNTSELFFVGKTRTSQLPLRLAITLDNVEFENQQAVVDKALTALPVTKFLIDKNGIGMQLAETSAARHGMRAEGVTFTNELKELWSVELKVKLQKAQVPLPLERDLSYQIHSIKKKMTAARNAVFDTSANEKQHHADKYWALALAVWAAKTDTLAAGHYGPNLLADYRG
jgi:phage FluMu gp28-like protein